MEYLEFYDIANYGNSHWKGSFSPREIADNAYEYKADFDWSIENGTVAQSIVSLLELLDEDGSEDAKNWASNIRHGLKIQNG